MAGTGTAYFTAKLAAHQSILTAAEEAQQAAILAQQTAQKAQEAAQVAAPKVHAANQALQILSAPSLTQAQAEQLFDLYVQAE